jgi:cysteinyl-tRNA synthetase
MRFLGIFNDRYEQKSWLTGRQWMSQMSRDLADPASKMFRDYRMAKANNDVEIARSAENWFNQNNISIQTPDSIIYIGNAQDKGFIESIVSERQAARKRKDWAESDRLRDQLTNLGVAIRDNKDGTTTWEKRR